MANKNKCLGCNVLTKAKEDVISCDVCLLGWHIKCLNMPKEEYVVLSKDNNAWHCDYCKFAAKAVKRQMIQMQQNLDQITTRLNTLEANSVSKPQLEAQCLEVIKSEESKDVISEVIKSVVPDMIRTEITEHDPPGQGATAGAQVNPSNEIRKSIQEYLNDLDECQKRADNLLFHKVEESEKDSNDDKLEDDKNKITRIIRDIDGEFDTAKIKTTTRLGKGEAGKKRPILVKFDEANTAAHILQNAKKLKGKNWNISISKDLPKTVRNYRSQLLATAKTDTESDEHFLYKVIGQPGKERIIKVKKNKGQGQDKNPPTGQIDAATLNQE